MYKPVKQVCATCGNVNRAAYPGRMVCYKLDTVRRGREVKPSDKCNRWKGLA